MSYLTPEQQNKISKIREWMDENEIAVITQHNNIKGEDLIADPVIWVTEDLLTIRDDYEDEAGHLTDEEFIEAWRGHKTLRDRSVEEGWEIIYCLLSMTDWPEKKEAE